MKGLKATFFKSNSGAEPVRNWLVSLGKEDRQIIGEDIKTIQMGWPLGMPLVRSLCDGLWETRSKLTSGRIARVIFFMNSNTIILLHGFIKKTQKTPNEELDLAKKRRKLYERHE